MIAFIEIILTSSCTMLKQYFCIRFLKLCKKPPDYRYQGISEKFTEKHIDAKGKDQIIIMDRKKFYM